jgi:hypothetical protein
MFNDKEEEIIANVIVGLVTIAIITLFIFAIS